MESSISFLLSIKNSSERLGEVGVKSLLDFEGDLTQKNKKEKMQNEGYKS